MTPSGQSAHAYRTKSDRSIINITDIQSFFILFSISFLPSAVCYLFTGDSHAPGTMISSAITLIILVFRNFSKNSFIILFSVTGFISLHLFVAYTLTQIQLDKATLSIFAFGFMFISSFILGHWLFYQKDKTIRQITAAMRILMVTIAIASILDFEPRGVENWEKPVFPFTEPSHYALIFTPLLLDACAKARGLQRYAWIALGYLLAYFLKSLSLGVGTTLAAIITLPLLQLTIAALAAPALLLSVNLTYFTDRLDFGTQTTNISSLVYIQGQELIFESLERTFGWGIGFQQLGYGPIQSPASKMIYQITGTDLNLYDGGFVAAKLISEFGFFGIFATIAFIVIATKSASFLRKVSKHAIPSSPGRDFAFAIIVGYSIDMFVRGVAYFTASSALFLAALIFYLKQKRTVRSTPPTKGG